MQPETQNVIAEELAEELQKIGIDIDSENGRREFRDTFAWAKKNKERCEKISLYVTLIIVGGIFSTIGAFLLDFIKTTFKG